MWSACLVEVGVGHIQNITLGIDGVDTKCWTYFGHFRYFFFSLTAVVALVRCFQEKDDPRIS